MKNQKKRKLKWRNKKRRKKGRTRKKGNKKWRSKKRRNKKRRKKKEEKNKEIDVKDNQDIKIDASTQQKQSDFNKDLCNSIANDLPKRTQTIFNSLKNLIQSKTNGLSHKEKSYIVFLWICDNISFDADSFFAGRKVDVTPEGIFKNGITVCSGYARLYKDIASYINLEVECVSCYAKGVGYEPGKILNKQFMNIM